MSASRALSVLLCAALIFPGAALAQSTVDIPSRGLGSDVGMRKTNTIKFNDLENPARKITPTGGVSDLFPALNLNWSNPQPLILENSRIYGLGSQGTKQLAYNHFVVVDSVNYDTMAGVYESNRLSGRSNFVTADSLVHCYFTFINTLTLRVIEDSLYAELNTFLPELIDACVKDYHSCEIAEVKDDIQRNLAYLLVAEKLLNPSKELPEMGGATDLARIEIDNLKAGRKKNSPVFNREEDYSFYRPLGFYSATVKASRFYSAYVWLSRMFLGLSDVTINTSGGGGNAFRRAVLMYRAIELGQGKDGKSLMLEWQHIFDTVNAFSQGQLAKEQSVYPRDMKSMFSAGRLEFKDLLYTLAQPLSRARLLLAIKKQRPQGLDATSIFDMDRARKDDDSLAFRIFSPLATIELDYLKVMAENYQDETADAVNPLSLYMLFAMGCPQANNTLAALSEKLDKKVSGWLPDFVRALARRHLEDSDALIAYKQPERRWSIISEYFRPLRKGAQAPVASQYWMVQRMLSTSAIFVDSLCAYDQSVFPATGKAAAGQTKAPEIKAPEIKAPEIQAPENPARETKKPAEAAFHYLEPAVDLYAKLGGYVNVTTGELTRLGVFPESLRAKSDDFKRLMERLHKIAATELTAAPMPLVDFRLLAGIDRILGAISGPTASSIYMRGATTVKTEAPGTLLASGKAPKVGVAQATETTGGASIGPGCPGLIYIIFNTDKGPYLSRGAVFSYFEVSGGPFKKEHWDRKEKFGFLRPPLWCAQFDLLEERDATVATADDKRPPADLLRFKKDPNIRSDNPFIKETAPMVIPDFLRQQ